MDDCITRKAAHEMVRNLTRYVNVEIREMHGVNEMVDYDDVQSGLDKIPAANAWISVKDGLPYYTSTGVEFIDAAYMRPFGDVESDLLDVYERRTPAGDPYFAVKAGMILLGACDAGAGDQRSVCGGSAEDHGGLRCDAGA